MKSTLILAVVFSALVGSGITYALTKDTEMASPNSMSMMNHGSSMSMSDMNDGLKNLKGDEFDKTFLTMMIEHHQGAIDMAKSAQENAQHQEIKAMATDIISAQSGEIDQMKSWQKQWGY